MANFKVPYLLWRDGRPRWSPGPRLRPHWKGRDLKDEAGAWLGLEAAIAAAAALNAEVAAWKGSGRPRRRPRPPVAAFRTVEDLFTAWWGSDDGAVPPCADFGLLAPRTQQDYRSKGRVFLAMAIDEHARLADAPLQAITKPHAFGVWEQLYRERGHSMATGVQRVVSAAFSYAEQRGWRPPNSNPWLRMGRPTPPPRLAIWLPKQIDTFLATADRMPGAQSVADAFVIGLHTGQRLGDVLAMPARIFAADRVCLSQLKTRALIDIRMTGEVRERVAAIRARWHAAGILARDKLLIDETTGQPYTPRTFNGRFRLVRAAAAIELPKVQVDGGWTGPKAYEIAELRYQDLRDTAVTRLALAENDANHIAAVTGHTLASIHSIMKHYLAMNRAMADAAIDRLEAWLAREGIAV